ncbi:MAG TPA: DUF2235 domain-containing protein [Albitalea sp.]|uniref:T6SS phospholipase effector Tle1-like catalytic domain-containing protein n=1 Tax=Piscinibacter sp. TaxID=1903157 RepID=UPI002ED187F8
MPVESASVPRQIVICCDGTNNTLTAGTEDTNVLLLHAHLRRHPPAPEMGVERVLYYDPGVGTPVAVPPTDPVDWLQRTWERVTGLASGRGVYDNIAQAYLFLMQHWRDERDRIYCFGFSRGAFTVRALVGMINLFGILKPQHEALLPTLIHVYFSLPAGRRGSALQEATRRLHRAVAKPGKAAVELGGHSETGNYVTRDRLAEQVRELFTGPAGSEAWVHWVGVWDTVESVGLPGPLSRSNPSTPTLRGKRVRHVRHALSLDEHRWTFEPRLYEEPGDVDDGVHTLRQRWFPGVHCDVGGSYPVAEAGLSDAALEWMVAEVASDLGVPRLAPGTAQRVRHDALWDTPWWALAGMSLRDMQPRTDAGEPIAVIPAPVASAPAASIWDRRRPWWPVIAAAVLGPLCMLLSGICLLPEGWRHRGLVRGVKWALDSTRSFASEQLASLWGHGLLAPGQAPWASGVQPGWAMLWDLGFIAAWGYLLARISSRAFSWLAGSRGPGSGLPPWRWLGMAPLLAVGGDVAEDALTLLAMAMHGIGSDLLANGFLWLTGLGALTKAAGLLACLPLVGVRIWIEVKAGMIGPARAGGSSLPRHTDPPANKGDA